MAIITGNNAQTFSTAAPNQTIVLAPDSTAEGLSSPFAGTLFMNYGSILGATTGVVFEIGASGSQFINKHDGFVTAPQLDAVVVGAAATSVTNHGIILGGRHGVVFGGGADHNSLVNTGELYGGTSSGVAVLGGTAQNISISNSGEIRSDEHGILMTNAIGAAPVIVNSGTIIGRINSILAQAGDRLNVTNSGALIGNVTATSVNQADKLINNGTVAGNVSLGTGVDLYQGSGSVSGYVNGEGGNDTLIGGASANRFNGGSEIDLLIGNGGNDVLGGAAGNDTLAGGLGNDVMAGGANSDFFIFNTAPNTSTNKDILNDFVAADDTLRFENAVFAKLGNAGVLNAQFLRLGAAPLDANDYLIYNKATGVLTYDVNGVAAGGAQQVAVITTKPTLALGDFVVI